MIYYYHSEAMPLYLLTLYGKGQKDNLTDEEKAILKVLVGELKKARGIQ